MALTGGCMGMLKFAGICRTTGHMLLMLSTALMDLPAAMVWIAAKFADYSACHAMTCSCPAGQMLNNQSSLSA
jgi:hypothetical protein